jgi:hypothetical protein
VTPTPDERELLDRGLEQVRHRLPPGWTVDALPGPDGTGRIGPNPMVTVRAQGTEETVALAEVRRSFTPHDARGLLGGPMGSRLRAMAGNTPIVVVAPHLSPRTRELLAADHIGYVDLTGNIRLEIQGLFVEVERTGRRPGPRPATTPGLRGARGGRLVRVLVDALPPFSLTDVSQAAHLDRGYASRILDALADQALIEREPRGRVTGVDWAALLRARAEHLTLLAAPGATVLRSPRGVRQVLSTLAERAWLDPWAVSGSFAAARFVPVAAPGRLVVYAGTPGDMVDALELTTAGGQGGDVVLIRPPHPGPFDRTEPSGGLVWAATSQVVLDCLSANGSMPDHGEALLEWMAGHEGVWRRPVGSVLAAPTGS